MKAIEKLLQDLRFWLLVKIAGKMHVAINITIVDGTLKINARDQFLFHRVHISGANTCVKVTA